MLRQIYGTQARQLRHGSVRFRTSCWDSFHLFKIAQLEKNFAFFTLVETNFKLTKIVTKKFHHKILLILSMEKDKTMFSILVNRTFLYFCVFSTQLMVLTHCYVLNMASHMIFSFFYLSVMWVHLKLTVTLKISKHYLQITPFFDKFYGSKFISKRHKTPNDHIQGST